MVDRCSICGSPKVAELLNLGKQPLANDLKLTPESSLSAECYDLILEVCENCTYVRLNTLVDPKKLFSGNTYLTGISGQTRNDMQDFALSCVERLNLKKNSKIIDVASNDGTLLSFFNSLNFVTLGIDPSVNATKIARNRGINTINDFFEKNLTNKIIDEFGKVDLVTMTNLITHVADPKELLISAKEILMEGGHIGLEFYYFDSLVSNVAFDQVYHEHISYFNFRSFNTLVKDCGLRIEFVEIVKSQGGSVRCFLSIDDGRNYDLPESVKEFFKREGAQKDIIERYQQFSKEVNVKKLKVLNFINSNRNAIICGYGASAKSTVFLNFLNLKSAQIRFIADMSQLKVGKYIPGTDIKVEDPIKIPEAHPDYIIIFAWNLAQEIITYLRSFLKYPVKYVLLTPDLSLNN